MMPAGTPERSACNPVCNPHPTFVRILDAAGSIDASVLSATRSSKGKIKVESPGSLAYQVVVPALTDFFTHYPGVRMALNIGNGSVDLIAENLDCV